MMKFFTTIFVLTAIALGVVSAGPGDDFNGTLKEMAAQVKPFLQKIPGIIETCAPIPIEDLKIVQDCVKAIPTEIPCLINNLLEKKPIDTCFDELIKDFSKILKGIDFIEAVIKNCPSKCVLDKFGVLKGDGLDVDKAAEKIAKYSFVSKYGLTTENIKENINNFLENTPTIFDDKPIDFFGMRNITIGCPKTKTALIAAGSSLAEKVGQCIGTEVEKIMKEMQNST